MRRKLGILLSTMVLTALVSVTPLSAASPESGKKASSVQINKTISADMRHLTKSVPPPKTAIKDAIPAEIDILYPEFSSSAEPKTAVQAIHAAVQKRLLALAEGPTPESVAGLMDAFAKQYEDAMSKAPELTGGWSLKFEAAIKYADEDLLALEILESVSTGGAHGDSKITNLVFSLKTGEPIALTAFVPEPKMKALNQVAEKIFRQSQNLKPAESLKDAGFLFGQENFAHNGNFLVSKAGLAFCFNPTEIAPYSKGIIDFVIPWEDLKTIIQADGLAQRFLPGNH